MKAGWEIKKLGEVCKIQTGKLDANAKVDDGDYPFFTCDSKPYRIDKFAFDDEAILISGNGSLVGHVNYYNGKFNAYQRTYVLTQFNSFSIPFLIKYLKSYLRPYIMENKKGGCIPYITLPILQNFLIPLPPLSEQERIVSELDLISGVIEKKKQQLKELDSLAQSIFYEMFGNPVENEKGWEVKKLTDVCSIQYGCPFDASLFSTSKTEGMPLIRIRDVKGGKTATYYTGSYTPEFIIHKGDYLIGMDGEFNIAPWQSEDALLNQRVCKIDSKSSDVTIQFVYRFLTKELKRIEDDTPFATVKHLSAKRLNQVHLSIPPLPLQQEFASMIESIERQKELIKQSLQETETLFNSRMDYYFNS